MDTAVVWLVVGLPGSGKSTMFKNLTDRVVHDDFLDNFYNGRVISAIKRGQRVCLMDPRLCFKKTFDRVILQIPSNNIFIILFENNPQRCIKNIKIRNRPMDTEQQLLLFSQHYDLNNYREYAHQVLPVYSNEIS